MKILYLTDSKIINNYILRSSTIEKQKGNYCFLQHGCIEPDIIDISCIFSFNKEKYEMLKNNFIDQGYNVRFGGTGFNLNMDTSLDYVIPDYFLYPYVNYSIGFTTRGCIRSCYFCIVRKKEGNFRTTQHISQWHNKKHTHVYFLDNNILIDKKWFYDNMQYVIENNLVIDNLDLDIRLVDQDVCNCIKKLKFNSYLHFAFDNIEDKDIISSKLQLLRENKIYANFYVYVDSRDQIKSAIDRIDILKKYKQSWHVMTKINDDKVLKLFKRYGSRAAYSRSHTFFEFLKYNYKEDYFVKNNIDLKDLSIY